MDSVIYLFRDVFSGKTYIITTIISSILIILSIIHLVKVIKLRRKKKKSINVDSLIPPADDTIPTPVEKTVTEIKKEYTQPIPIQEKPESENLTFKQTVEENSAGDVVYTEDNTKHSVYSGDSVDLNNQSKQ